MALRVKLTLRAKLTLRVKLALRVKLTVRVTLTLRGTLTLRAKSTLRAKFALRGSPAAPGTPARGCPEPRKQQPWFLHQEASLYCKRQGTLHMCSLRAAPQGLVDLTPSGLRGEAVLGSGWPCKLEA